MGREDHKERKKEITTRNIHRPAVIANIETTVSIGNKYNAA